jgi:purine-binding chemotaxis protein CheW
MIDIQVHSHDTAQIGKAKVMVDDAQSHLTFFLANQLYAVNLTSIREVRKMPRLTRVAHAPDYILGVGSVRGEIVPTVDLKKRFGLSIGTVTSQAPMATPRPEDQLILITEIDGRRAAVTVDSISEVITISKNQISPIPKTAMAIDIKYLHGLVQHEGKVLLLVDLQKIMDPDELHATANTNSLTQLVSPVVNKLEPLEQ